MRNAILFFYSLLIIFFVVLASVIAKDRKEGCIKSYNGFATEGELRAMRYLHRYHGTDSSSMGYFYRDGERCVLFDPRVRIDQ